MKQKIITPILGLLVCVCGLIVFGQTSDKDWAEAERNFQAEYSKPTAAKDGKLRLAALEKLQGLEHPQLVKLLIGKVIPNELNGNYPLTIDVALDILGKLNSDECIKELVSETKKAPANVKIVLMRALGATAGKPPVAEMLIAFLDDKDYRIKLGAIDALSQTCPKEALDKVIAALEAKEWEVRSSATQYLGKVTDEESKKKAADALTKQAPKESGRLREEMLAVVRRLTGKDESSKADDTFAVFYGMKITSQTPVFVVDISSSMKMFKAKEGGSRFEVLIKELKNVVEHLSPDARFNIIIFNDKITAWQKNLVLVKQYRKEALEWIDKLQSSGLTNIYDALEAGFGFTTEKKDTNLGGYCSSKGSGADTIYFMTDGEPTAGKYLNTNEILSAVRILNQTKKIRINVIAVGVGGGEAIPGNMPAAGGGKPPAGMGGATGKVDTEFLKKLAEQNDGEYVEK